MRVEYKEYLKLKEQYQKAINYIKKLSEVEDYEYPFSLNDRDDIEMPSDFLKEIGE